MQSFSYNCSQNGEYKLIAKLPDTLTSWAASGFSVSNTTGLAIASKTEVTHFGNKTSLQK